MSVGTNLKTFRNNLGITQKQLADKSGLSVDAITRLELDQRSPNVTTLEKLAHALGILPAMLLDPSHPKQEAADEMERLWFLLRYQPAPVRRMARRCVEALIDELTKDGVLESPQSLYKKDLIG